MVTYKRMVRSPVVIAHWLWQCERCVKARLHNRHHISHFTRPALAAKQTPLHLTLAGFMAF